MRFVAQVEPVSTMTAAIRKRESPHGDCERFERRRGTIARGFAREDASDVGFERDGRDRVAAVPTSGPDADRQIGSRRGGRLGRRPGKPEGLRSRRSDGKPEGLRYTRRSDGNPEGLRYTRRSDGKLEGLRYTRRSNGNPEGLRCIRRTGGKPEGLRSF
jgi:hypothetical protein